MSRFVESIRILDGRPVNMAFHQIRFERTRRDVMGLTTHPDLSKYLDFSATGPAGLCKCRLLYDKEVSDVQIQAYRRPEITSIRLVYSDHISYPYKYTDRKMLDELFNQRADCEDIIIVKNGLVTDSYAANVVFSDGNSLVTPDSPLLPGTMREFLLRKGEIREMRITADMIGKFSEIRLINALNDLEEAPRIRISQVI